MKSFIITAVVAFAGLKASDAACAYDCSGHGRCTNYKPTFSGAAADSPFRPDPAKNALGYDTSISKKDSCTCFLRREDGADIYDYTNPDCSGKTCPSGKSINALPLSNNDHTQMVECSNVGTCDRTTGTCTCQQGFTGKACNRRKCPNNCNNRGQCKMINEIVEDVTLLNSKLDWTSSGLTYTAWDETISAGCHCDVGYHGPDCSIAECPSTVDPMAGFGSESGRECSGRGICNYAKGTCGCFSGYHGTACEQQLVNMG